MDDPLQPLADALDRADSMPFLFVGSGVSRRYLGLENFKDLLTWAADLTDKPLPFYLGSAGDLPGAASQIGEAFYRTWWEEPKYLPSRRQWADDCVDKQSPLKFVIAKRLSAAKKLSTPTLRAELALLKKCEIDGVITTNYDTLLEGVFDSFKVFVGQEDLLLSRSYQLGEIYKIHGSVTEPNGMVLCQEDYERFAESSAYLVAKLMSVFVEHPVVFLGYSLSDPNIRVILTSLLNCMSAERAAEFKDRFIWVDYEEGLAAPAVDDFLIDLGAGRLLPVLRVRTASFAPVFRVLSKLERAVPLGLLRRVAENIVEIVRSSNPTKYLSVQELDDLANVEDKTLVVGVSMGGGSAAVGFRTYDRYDLIKDAVVDDPALSDHAAVVRDLLPEILRKLPNAWTPVCKYVADSGLAESEIPEVVRAAMVKPLRPAYTTVLDDVSQTTNDDLVAAHGVGKALGLLRSMADDEIDVERLQALIRDNIDGLREADTNLKTAIAQATIRLDRLLYGPDAAARPTPPRKTLRKKTAPQGTPVAARAASGPNKPPKQSRLPADGRTVRAWALEKGLEVSSRGRIPQSVLDKYERQAL